jgi:hypothetical protein
VRLNKMAAAVRRVASFMMGIPKTCEWMVP